jgi:hypothetical protein
MNKESPYRSQRRIEYGNFQLAPFAAYIQRYLVAEIV